jgi:O-antigen ligase
MNKFFTIAEKWFILFSVTFLTGNPIKLLLGPDTSLETLVSLVIYAISFLFLVLRWKQALTQVIKRGKLILVVDFIVVASSLWSGFPVITLRNSMYLLGATCFGIYFATRYDLKQQVRILARGFGVIVLMSLIFGAALPKYGRQYDEMYQGVWRGIYMHKNSLGFQMALSGVLFIILLIGSDRKKWAAWAGCVFSFVLVILSRSAAALVDFLILASLLPLFSLLRFRWNLRIPVLTIALLVIGGANILLLGYKGQLLGALGKDETLTGRTDMWPYVWDMIEKRPWLGYGYEGFWRGWNSESDYIWRAVGWKPPHAHNGFLELLLIFGWLGTSIYMFGFLINFLKSLNLIHLNRSPEAFWPAIYLIFIILTNISEKNILFGMNWALYVAVSLLPVNSSSQDIANNPKLVDFQKVDSSYLSEKVEEG